MNKQAARKSNLKKLPSKNKELEQEHKSLYMKEQRNIYIYILLSNVIKLSSSILSYIAFILNKKESGRKEF